MSNRKGFDFLNDADARRRIQRCTYDEWLDRIAQLGRAQQTATPEPTRPRVMRGDVWQLGVHRLCCGDSTSHADVDRLMNGAKADFVFTSPPYADQRTYADERRSHPHSSKTKTEPVRYEPPKSFDALMRGIVDCLPLKEDAQVLVNFGQVIRDGEILEYFDDWKQYMKSFGFKHRDTYIFNKTVAKPFVIWRLMRQHEEIFHYSKQTRIPHKTVQKKPASINHARKYYINRGVDGSMWRQENSTANSAQTHKQESSVFTISPQAGEDRPRRNVHPAVFPLELVRRIVPIWTNEREIVFEPFLGSGTTLLVCEEIHRRCYGMEISPTYCGHILDAWEQQTGQKAVRMINKSAG